jgi:predicted PurR-regulated permease PerM
MTPLSTTVKRSIELLGLCALAIIIYYAKDILMPLLTAFFLSILLLPVYRVLCKWRFPQTLAIFFSILLAALIVGFVIWFFGMQISKLVKDIPEIQNNLNSHWQNLSGWINAKTAFSSQEQLDLLRKQSDKLLSNAGIYLSGAAVSLTGIFVFVGLLPIYIFLFMFYKNLLLRFTFLWFEEAHHESVEEALRETESIVKSYLIGLMIQISYITILLGGALWIMGIKHALLIGIIFGILNLIPYVGALIGNIIGVLLTLTASQELWHVVAVLVTIAVVQFLDNNILMPRIVGSKVQLNAFASIVGVLIGGSLAGVSGMFLSLPIMAVLKIIFDKSPAFRKWGLLLGDENPGLSPMSNYALRLRNKREREESSWENDRKNTPT